MPAARRGSTGATSDWKGCGMRKFWFVVVTLGLVVSALAPAWMRVEAAPPAQRSSDSACKGVDEKTGRPLVTRVISPSNILQCQTAEVSMTVGAQCGDIPLHIMVDIDRSGSMVGQP